MNCESYRLHIILRRMAWARAKGELESILETFWNDQEEFERMDELFGTFIEEIEDASPLA